MAQTSRPYGMISFSLVPSGFVNSASMCLSVTFFTMVFVRMVMLSSLNDFSV